MNFVYSAEYRTLHPLSAPNSGAPPALPPPPPPPSTQQLVVRDGYAVVLGRQPESAAAESAWVQWLLAGNPNRSLLDVLYFSAEAQNRFGSLNNAGFVSLLYSQMLGRAADAGGLAAWTAVLDGGASRKLVFDGFAGSPEFFA